jgi:ABC-type oligopeptide transport system substrate-binding subunit
MSRKRIQYVTFLALTSVMTFVLSSCGGQIAPTPTPLENRTGPPSATGPAEGSAGTLNGVALPPDAAPPDQQVFVGAFDNTADFTTLDILESVYKRGAFSDILSDPLVRLDKNFKIQPGAATKWEVDSSGLVWTFYLDPNLVWSDDTRVTADDYVASFRYAADPKHAWDFTWFFQGIIKNWAEVTAGKVPLDELGVTAVDTHTFQVTTEVPAPYLPAMMLYSEPLQKKALEKYGGLYNSNPATSVSSGPFVLKEWRKGERLVFEANPKYGGTNKPFIQRLVAIGASSGTLFTMYQGGEIDALSYNSLSPAEKEIIAGDPELQKEMHPQPSDFRTDYLFFDTQNPPFNNIKVRQAFSHIVDRDSLIEHIIKPGQGIPAYSFLMPGFPGANSEGLKEIQGYDVAKAQQLLAEAGYPGGKGFPKLTLWLRAEGVVNQSVAQAIAASIKQNLGIDVQVSNKETKTFMDALNSKPTQIQFGMVSYGMDFLDPYNMLSVWLGGGRHNWNNTEYDNLVKKTASFTGSPDERMKMFQDAERLLVSDAPAVFIYHRYQIDMYKPYLKGTELEPDQNGVAAMHWPGYSGGSQLIGSMYISKDVAKYKRKIPNR